MVVPKITNASGKSQTLKAQKGVFVAKDDFRLRKFDEGVPLDSIRKSLEKNNLDEVVFETDAGEHYVVYAENIIGQVAEGDTIDINGLSGVVKMVDDEPNRKRRAAAGIAVMGVLGLTGGLALGAVAGVAYTAAVTGNVITGGAEIGMLIANTVMGAAGGSVAGGAGASGVSMAVAHKKKAFASDDEFIQGISKDVKDVIGD